MQPIVYLELAAAALAGIGILTFGALRGWRGWLDLKQLELQAQREPGTAPASTAGNRIEIADLKERIRKLEAIAAGVDL